MKKTTAFLIVAIVLWFAGVSAGSEGSGGQENPIGKNAFDTSSALKSLATSVVVIVALGAAAIYLTKKVMPKVNAAMGKELRVVESLSLGARKQIYLVKVGSRKLLIGGASESITYLADVTDALKEGGKNE
jgi:flagellar biosynthetic protein FliO